MSQAQAVSRRQVGARNNAWIRASAAALARRGWRPNHVSLLSIVFSAATGAAILVGGGLEGPGRIVVLAVAALAVGGRGLCNLLDGLIAIEGGRRTQSGEIFNDLPDRVGDTIVLLCAGYAAAGPFGPALGWAAALAAAMTAYVRLLGAASGAGHDFRGPMAKTGRMAVLVVGVLVASVEPWWGWSGQTLAIALGVIIAGCAVTIVRRTAGAIRTLEKR